MTHRPIGADDATGELPGVVETRIHGWIDTGDAGVQANLDQEIIDRQNADTTLQDQIDDSVQDGDPAGGVLSGTYPNPAFAVDMATQAELDAQVALLVPLTQKGAANGVATLDTVGKVTLSQLNRVGSPLIRTMVESPVMSSPPTLTASTTPDSDCTRTLRFASGNTNYWSGFRVSGAPYVNDGSTTTARAKGATKGTPAANAWGGTQRIEFDLYTDKFQFTFQNTASAKFKIWVDGVPHSLTLQATSTVSGVSGSGTNHFTVNFGSDAFRRITLELASLPASASLTQGIRVRPTATVLPPSIPSPKFMVIGDSYGYGVGATDNSQAYTIRLSRLLGFGACWNYTCVPSTGVISTDAPNDYGNYSSRFAADVIPYLTSGDVLVYQGSINDSGLSAGAVQTQATTDLNTLKAALPGVSIIVVGPLYMQPATAGYTTVNNEMSAAAAAAGLPFVDGLRTALPIWTGTGSSGAPTGDGNADVNAINSGGIHPTSIGAKLLGHYLAGQIGPLINNSAS